tara:strand:- start:6370 stop:6969 length:600 start_codon:yes stop_codon:yes gene_type:complete
MKLNFFNLKKNSFPKIISIIFFLGTYVYSTPYLALLSLKQSFDNERLERAEKFINFPSVQKDLENQIMSVYKKNTFNESSEISFPRIGLVLFDPLIKNFVGLIVSSTVTPEGLKLLITKGELSNNSFKSNSLSSKKSSNNIKPVINLYYESFNKFIMSSDISRTYDPIKFRFLREGIIHWKLISVEIPINQLADQVIKQ